MDPDYAPNFGKVGDILASACMYVCMYVCKCRILKSIIARNLKLVSADRG